MLVIDEGFLRFVDIEQRELLPEIFILCCLLQQ